MNSVWKTSLVCLFVLAAGCENTTKSYVGGSTGTNSGGAANESLKHGGEHSGDRLITHEHSNAGQERLYDDLGTNGLVAGAGGMRAASPEAGGSH